MAANAQPEGVSMPGREPSHVRDDRGAARAVGCLAVLLVLALAAGAAAWRYDLVDRWWPREAPDPATEPAVIAPPPGLDLPVPADPPPVARPVQPAESGAVLPGAVRRALARGLRDEDLGRHVVAAVGSLSGTGPTYRSGDPATFVPASTTKLLTGVAALEALGPDHRFSTTVRRGPGNRVVLVGGGDPYLASRPVPARERDSTFPARADVTTLAAQVARSLREAGRTRVRVGYDATLFTGPADNPRWEPGYVPDGVVTPVTSLWVDQGVAESGWGRVEDPPAEAAEAFARALRRRGVTVVGAPRPAVAGPSGDVLGRVSGAPLAQVVERLVEVSDNEAAEVVARHVGLAVARDASFEGAVRGVRRTLAGLGVDVRGSRWYDGSGLSRSNRLTATLLLDVLRVASASDRPDLRAGVTGLPVAGFSGSLQYRFADGSPEGLGRVRAKTGTLVEGGVHGLAGLVTDRRGTPLVFAITADRVRYEDALDAREAIDRLAAALAACACSRPAG